MNIKTQFNIIVILSATLLLPACDPGYRMYPTSGEVEGHEQWVNKFDGFELRVNKIGGLIGEWWIDLNVTVNTESKPIIIERVELQTSNGIYQTDTKLGLKAISAFSSSNIHLSWQFKDQTPASKIIGDLSLLVFYLKLGNEERKIEIEYKRTS